MVAEMQVVMPFYNSVSYNQDTTSQAGKADNHTKAPVAQGPGL